MCLTVSISTCCAQWYHKYDTFSPWECHKVDKQNTTLNPLNLSSVGVCPWEIQVPASLSALIQSVHLQMKARVYGGPPILIMSILWLHLDLDQLENEARWPWFTPVTTSELSFFFLLLQVDFCNFGNVRQRHPPSHSIHLLLSHRHRALPDLMTPLIFCCWRTDRATLVLLHVGLIQQRKGGVRNFQEDVCTLAK